MKVYIFTSLTAFILSLVLCLLLIPVLRRLKAGQNILSYVKEHKNKAGTPTMGGLAFVIAGVIASVLFTKSYDKTFLIAIVVSLAYMSVGFLDDLLKCKHKENLGLKAWQKFTFQSGIAIFVAIYCYRAGIRFLNIPFLNSSIDLGFWCVPFIVFVFLATVNAVNLTDGMDGLAGGDSFIYFLILGIVLVLQNQYQGLTTLSFAVCGALLGFLLFNTNPASVFMGDTGSLALGGFMACISCFTGNALYILVVGLPFVLSVISVLLQVIYYKVTGGKRIFLMAPLHHHFQQIGYSETKIAYAYSLISLLLGGLAIAFLV